MCDLCSKDPKVKEAEKQAMFNQAKELEDLALLLKRMATGAIHPHSQDAKPVGALARDVIKFLSEEYA